MLVKRVAEYGLKLGIYTAVSARTCAGYIGSLHYEKIDAQTFLSWGMGFVKHDTCGVDCGVHDGCLQASTGLMADTLHRLDPSGARFFFSSIHF